jgi:hypothetical protein
VILLQCCQLIVAFFGFKKNDSGCIGDFATIVVGYQTLQFDASMTIHQATTLRNHRLDSKAMVV